MKRLLLAAVVVLALVPNGAAASVRGSPDLAVSLEENTVSPGTDTTVRVHLVNRGDLAEGSSRSPELAAQVTTARGVTVSLDASDDPFEVETASRVVGRLPQGASRPLGFRLSVPDDVDSGTYTLPVTVSYSHTAHVDETTGTRETRDVERTFQVTVEIREAPRFRIVDVEDRVRAGGDGTVDLTVENVGSATARETSVAVNSENGDLRVGGAQSATRFVGDWDPGETRTVSYRVTASPDANAHRYALVATASYETEDGDAGRSGPLRFAVRPGARQTFAVVDSSSDVAVGEDGTVSVTVRNEGPVDVDDATVELASSHSDLRFGTAASATRFVGAWQRGETRTLTYEVEAADGAEPRSYAMTATVAYRDDDGDRRTARAGPLGVTPGPEPDEPGFATTNVSGTLRVGADGHLRGSVVNDGAAVADDTVLVLESPGTGLTAERTEYPVGDLAPGDRVTFAFDIAVSADATAGPRQFTLVPEYRDDDGDARTGDSLTVRHEIGEEREPFAVRATNASVAPGGSTTYTVEVTNTGDGPVSDVSAKLFADDPVSTVDDEAYIPDLQPGETGTLTFEVRAGGSAMAKAYPLSVDLRYDDADGDTKVTDSGQVALTVAEPSGGDGSGGLGGPATLLGGIGALALVGAGAYVRFG